MFGVIYKNIQNRLIFLTCLCILYPLANSCGAPQSGAGTDSSSAATVGNNNSGNPLNSTKTALQVPVSVIEDVSIKNTNTTLPAALRLDSSDGLNSSGLDLISNASSFSVTLTGCSSGLTGTNASNGILEVYLSDTNCVAQLTSFVIGSQTYLPSGVNAVPFSSWTVGSTAVYQSTTSNTNLYYIKIAHQLSSPIVSTDTVGFTYSAITVSNTGVSVSTSPGSQTLYVSGVDAPNFQITSGNATYSGLITSGGHAGYGIFTFKVTCAVSAMTVGANVSYNSFCPTSVAGGTIAGGASGTDVGTNFSYKLISDLHGNGTITMSDAQSAFQAGGDSTVTLSTDILSGSTGFQISSYTGTGPIATNSKMILILQSKNPNAPTDPGQSSYQYFYVQVQTFNP